ncbi:MAG TPA: MetQ/NlpA family ABC transporter substrate-binding protein [Pyrinomonadaceae bacterium]
MSGASAQNAPQLPPRARRRRPVVGIVIAAIVVIVAVVLAIVLTRGGDSSNAAVSGRKAQTVSIGVADASQSYWKTYSALAKKKYNVTIKLVNFSDYSQPNPALSEGQTDLNQFQHIQYLANYNVTTDDDLQPIGATAVYPLPLYSTKYSSVADIPKDAKVAIPNDAVNEARGLLVLQAAKLLTLKDGGSAFSTTKDIVSSNVNIVPLDASQTAGAVKSGSVAAAIVNKNFATDAGLKVKSALFQDDPSSAAAAPYVNVFAARKADANNPLYAKLAALYHEPSVEKGVQAANGGTAVFKTTSAAGLQAELAKVEADAKAAAK